MAKIARRVKEYKINVLNEPRPGKKLLVLDVDYTLFGTIFSILLMVKDSTNLLWIPNGPKQAIPSPYFLGLLFCRSSFISRKGN